MVCADSSKMLAISVSKPARVRGSTIRARGSLMPGARRAEAFVTRARQLAGATAQIEHRAVRGGLDQLERIPRTLGPEALVLPGALAVGSQPPGLPGRPSRRGERRPT